jgi:hypothetical protein
MRVDDKEQVAAPLTVRRSNPLLIGIDQRDVRTASPSRVSASLPNIVATEHFDDYLRYINISASTRA